MDYIKLLEKTQEKKETPDFKVGDTLKIQLKIIEGDKERLQSFEGVCIEKRHSGLKETFTLRRLSHGVGVERTVFLHSPYLEKIQVTKRGTVRRSKLYYLRKKIGKKAKIKEERAE